MSVSGQEHNQCMSEEKMRKGVSTVVTSTLKIVFQAGNSEEAADLAGAIDIDKRSVVNFK